jgi:hypothetical protein
LYEISRLSDPLETRMLPDDGGLRVEIPWMTLLTSEPGE